MGYPLERGTDYSANGASLGDSRRWILFLRRQFKNQNVPANYQVSSSFSKPLSCHLTALSPARQILPCLPVCSIIELKALLDIKSVLIIYWFHMCEFIYSLQFLCNPHISSCSALKVIGGHVRGNKRTSTSHCTWRASSRG